MTSFTRVKIVLVFVLTLAIALNGVHAIFFLGVESAHVVLFVLILVTAFVAVIPLLRYPVGFCALLNFFEDSKLHILGKIGNQIEHIYL